MNQPIREQAAKWLKKRDNRLLVMIVAGLLLLIFAWPQSPDSGEDTEAPEETEESSGETSDYEEEMERRLREILSQVDGAGEVEVMITLSASAEQVLQEDEDSEKSEEEESSQGSLRSDSAEKTSRKTFTGEDDSPVVVQEKMPVVEGVVVVAEGASSAVVKQEITEAVQALFPIEAHKIKVLKRVAP